MTRGRTGTGGDAIAKLDRKAKDERRREANANLQQYMMKLPSMIDVEAMQTALAEAEKAECDKDLTEPARKKLQDAEKVIAKKRERERLLKLEQRREDCTAQLKKVRVGLC
jgi:hypothetical protein